MAIDKCLRGEKADAIARNKLQDGLLFDWRWDSGPSSGGRSIADVGCFYLAVERYSEPSLQGRAHYRAMVAYGKSMVYNTKGYNERIKAQAGAENALQDFLLKNLALYAPAMLRMSRESRKIAREKKK